MKQLKLNNLQFLQVTRGKLNCYERQALVYLHPFFRNRFCSLFAYPSQSNFSGCKYPLTWIDEVKKDMLSNCFSKFFYSKSSLFLSELKSCICTIRVQSNGSSFEIKKIRSFIFIDSNEANEDWTVLLDAASFVSTSHLDLNLVYPDFVCLSFYKIFGFPTGFFFFSWFSFYDPSLLKWLKIVVLQFSSQNVSDRILH